jgi:hypothetical protein
VTQQCPTGRCTAGSVASATAPVANDVVDELSEGAPLPEREPGHRDHGHQHGFDRDLAERAVVPEQFRHARLACPQSDCCLGHGFPASLVVCARHVSGRARDGEHDGLARRPRC